MEPYQQLERDWAEFNDLDPAGMVACASGTSALHLALEAMRARNRGTRVMLPDFTMIACARAVTLADMEPIFIDCDEYLNIDAELVRKWAVHDCNTYNMYGQGYAIMAVHVYGRRCDMDNLAESAGDCGTMLIEDLAEAHGVKPHPLTDAACWSFYKNKIVAGEEGGAVWFRNPAHASLARQLRSLGFTDAHDFMHVPRGHNYRMSNLHAEVVLASLDKYYWNLGYRDQIVTVYDLHCQAGWRMPPRDAPWVYDLRIPGITAAQQDRIVAALQAAGIAARHGFKPMSVQPEYVGCKVVGDGKAAVAAREAVYLPLTPGLVTPESARQAFEIVKNQLT